MTETRKDRLGKLVEQGIVAGPGRRTIVYDDPDTGQRVSAITGEPIWADPEELATMRQRGHVVDPNNPDAVSPYTLHGPQTRFDEPEAGLIKTVTH